MGGLEPARVIGVTHALRVIVYAYLALGSSGKQRDALHVVPELAEAGGVRLPFVDPTLVFFKGLDDFNFLGGVVPLPAFRFSLGGPLFGVGGCAMQMATSGAKVTPLMVVPNVTQLQ